MLNHLILFRAFMTVSPPSQLKPSATGHVAEDPIRLPPKLRLVVDNGDLTPAEQA